MELSSFVLTLPNLKNDLSLDKEIEKLQDLVIDDKRKCEYNCESMYTEKKFFCDLCNSATKVWCRKGNLVNRTNILIVDSIVFMVNTKSLFVKMLIESHKYYWILKQHLLYSFKEL